MITIRGYQPMMEGRGPKRLTRAVILTAFLVIVTVVVQML
jgi:hypothetical protein